MLLDFIFIFILLIITLSGYRKGFTSMAISFLAFVVSIIFVFIIYNYAGELLLESSYGKKMQINVSENVSNQFDKIEESAIDKFPYIASISKITINDEKIIDFGKLSDVIAKNAVKSLLSFPLVIISFIITKFIIFLIRTLVRQTTAIPIIHGTDCILGAMCGFLMGIFAVAIFFLMLSFIQFIPSMRFVQEQFDSSAIVLLINDYIF